MDGPATLPSSLRKVTIRRAPTGTSGWIGPLLARTFPAGSLGQGGANGLQFPSVTKYFGVAPGQYDMQVVASGSTDCTTGLLPVTPLPALGLDSRRMLVRVTIGVQRPDKVDAAAVRATMPHGEVSVLVVKGGLDVPDNTSGDIAVIASAAVAVRLDLPQPDG